MSMTRVVRHDGAMPDMQAPRFAPPESLRGDHTDGVSDLPPPVPPPPADPDAVRRSRPDDADWARLKDLAERWYQPLLQPESWRALGYLFVGMFSGIGFFVVMAALGGLVFALMFVVVGILLVGPLFRVVDALAGAERRMAAWVGVEIPPRPLAPPGRYAWSVVTDPNRWRQVAYLAANVVMGWVLFGFGAFAYSIVFQVVFGDGLVFAIFPSPLAVIGLVIGLALAAVALGAAPRLAVLVARLKAQIAAWFLGPDELAIAQQRVSTLSTQRQDILDAVASERRRIERNLHDGVQQQLVAIGLDLGMAEQHIDDDPARARELLHLARGKVQGSIGELRQLGRGLHPAILEDRGLDAALSAVVAGAVIPISVHVDHDLDLSTDVAETVYFIANEAVANVLKHAHARVASVHIAKVASDVRVTIHDDGVGGADPTRGTGLAGIRARVNAVDGTLAITSPPGGPTTVVAQLPRRPGAGR